MSDEERPLAAIVALSARTRGEPITTTRPYGLIPIANETLLHRQLAELKAFRIIVVYNEANEAVRDAAALSARIECVRDDDERLAELLASAALVLPGDLLPAHMPPAGLIAHPHGSEEQGEAERLLKRLGVEREASGADDTLRVNYPWEILDANQRLIKGTKPHIDPSATVEEGAVIKGNVHVGKRTVIRAGSYIEGPAVIGDGCEIGPMAHIRPDTAIGDGCKVGKSEVVDAVLMKGTVSKHVAYLGHSVLGEDVNVGAFTVTSDFRHDGQAHTTLVRGERIATGRRKLGAFIGDHARIGVSTAFYPGRKLAAHATTLPGEVVAKDKE